MSAREGLAFRTPFANVLRFVGWIYVLLVPLSLVGGVFNAVLNLSVPLCVAYYASRHGLVRLTRASLQVTPHYWTPDRAPRVFLWSGITEAIPKGGRFGFPSSIEVRAGEYFAMLPFGLIDRPQQLIDAVNELSEPGCPLRSALATVWAADKRRTGKP